jgi:hypothetical protein
VKLLLTTLTATALSVAALQAQVTIINDNFTELTQGANLAAWSAGVANNTVTAQPVGLNGAMAVQWQVDFPTSYNGYQAYQWESAGITGNTSPNPGDYTVSFWLDVVGPTAFNAIQLNVQAANSWSGPWGGTGAAAVPVSPTLGWQQVSVPLNSSIFSANALTPQGSIWQLQFQLNGWQLQGGGPATGEEVVLDDLSVTMAVPEPCSLALVGLGAAALLVFRRR